MNKHLRNGIASAMVSLGLLSAPSTMAYGSYRNYGQRFKCDTLGKTQGYTGTRGACKTQGASTAKALSSRVLRPSTAKTLALISPNPAFKPSTASANDPELEIRTANTIRELVIIDANVADKHIIYRQLKSGMEAKEVHSDADGLIQLKQILSRYENLEALHLFSHADDGIIRLGSSSITQDLLSQEINTLSAIDKAMKDGADILLYGCNLAKSEKGEQLLELLSSSANVDVAASNDFTGNQILNGDWDLEVVKGNVNIQMTFDSVAMKDFSSVLPYSGTLTLDNPPNTGYTSSVSYTIPTTSYDMNIVSNPAGFSNLYSGFGFLYVGTGGSTNTSTVVSFSVGETFDLTSLYLYNSSGSTRTIQVTSNLGGSESTGSLSDLGGTTVNFSGANWTGISQFSIQYDGGGALNWTRIEDIAIANLAPPPIDSDGSLTAAGAVTEPVAIETTIDSVGEAINVFDFTLSDGGTADGLAMDVSQVVLNVTGTASDAQRANVTWRLNGPDASNVTGVYNGGSDTITFSGLSMSIADGGSETYTINAYYNDNTGLTEGTTYILSVDGDTDLTVGGSGTQMGATSAVTNGSGSTASVTATALAFTTQPATSVSGTALGTQPVVTARDAFGNIDIDFTETVTVTEASAGTLTNNTAVASSGAATFSSLTYTATADQQSFTLTANDQDGVGSDLPTVDANAVTSDVVATTLVFDTQPVPLSVGSGVATNFTTVPVVSARDGNNVVDTGYSTDISLAEVNGAGSATMTATGDSDGSGATVSITPSSGVSAFTSMQITYTASGGSSENFNLRASSGGLSTVDSSQMTGLVDSTPPTITDGNISISGASGTGGAYIVGDTVTATWNNTAGGDNNDDVATVTVDFSQFGGGAAASASNSSDTWTATYTITEDGGGSIDATNRNVSVTATDTSANADTVADTTNATVDNDSPVVSDGNISISGATGSGGAFIAGDTVTATWNNTAGGDNNSDTISSVTVDFSQFGGGAAVVASNSSDTWTATYTIVAGAIDGTNLNVSTTATDNAGNTATAADTSNATVDNGVPSITNVTIPSAAAVVGDAITVTITASEAGLSLNSGTVNGVAVTGFTDSGGGAYSATYTVAEGQTDRAAGDDIPVSFVVDDSAGNSSATYTTAISQGGDAIDANSPSVTTVTIPNAATAVGDAITVTIIASEAGLSLTSGTVNGVAVTGFSDNGGGSYSATYTVAEGHTDRAAGDDIPVSFALDDGAGNSSTTYTTAISQNADSIDANSPTVTNVTIPNAAAVVGDAITVTITALEAGLSLNTGTVNGVAVTGFSDNGGGAYSATYTVAEGHADRAAGDDIPVSFALDDGAGNSSTTYTTAISQNADSIDANSPTVTNVTIPNAAAVVGDAITVTIAASEAGLSLNSGTVNGVAVTGFTDSGGGAYSATYTVAEGQTDRAAGDDIPVSFVLDDGAGNSNAAYTTAISQNADSIDANSPTVTNVTIPNTAAAVGDAITVTITASEAGLSLTSGTVNGVAVTGFSDNGGGAYSATYTVAEGHTDRAAGDDIPVSFALDDGAGNSSTTYTTAISQNADSIDANSPTVTNVTIPNTAAAVGDAITVTITAPEAGLSLTSGTVNGVAVTGFSDNGGGAYSATYTVAEGHTDRAAGDDIPVSFVLDDDAGNSSAAYTAAISQGGDAINANSPSVTNVTIPNAAAAVGDAITVTITASEAGLSLNSGTVNGIAVTGFSDSGSGSYSATYTVAEGHTDRAAGDDIPVSFVLDDGAGNSSAAFTIAISQNADSIDANSPSVTSVSIPNAIAGVGDAITVTIMASESGLSLNTGTVNGVAVTSFSDDGGGNYSATYTVAEDHTDRAAADDIPVSFRLTDSAGNSSAIFTTPIAQGGDAIDTGTPLVSETTAVSTPTNDATPAVSISTTEAGTLAVGGSCGSTNEGVIGTGTQTITLTQSDNSTALVSGTYSDCSVTVTDAAGNASSPLTLSTFVVDVTTPSLDTNTTISLDEGDTALVVGNANLSASDNVSAAEAVTFTLTGAPGEGTLRRDGAALAAAGTFTQADINNSLITYDHDAGEVSSDSFSFTLSDALGNSSAGFTFTLNITDVNDAPTTVGDSASVDEDNNVIVNVLSNDSDADGTLNAASVLVVSGPSNGTTSTNTATGAITYTPALNFNGNDSFSYTVDDNDMQASLPTVVTITVNAINDLPVAQADSASIDVNTSASIDVAANDSDVDTGDSLDLNSITIVTAPSNGTAVVNPSTQQIDYTPATNFDGTDTFTYTIDDSVGATSLPATVTVTVSNSPPTAANDSATVDEDVAIEINVLSNDADTDGLVDPSTVAIVTPSANGSTEINTTTGAITFTPAANFNGNTGFTYTVQDDAGATSAPGTVSITVNAINDAPQAVNDTAGLMEDQSFSINVLGNDSDVDGTLDASTVSVVEGPESGIATIEASGAIVYTPLEDFAGSDSFTYQVNDNLGLSSNIATVTLTVDPVNDAPLANNDSADVTARSVTVIDILGNDQDIDGDLDAASIVFTVMPTQGVLTNNNDGTVSYTANQNANVLAGDSFSYTVDDNSGASSNAATVTLRFLPENAPAISGTPTAILEDGQQYSFVPTVDAAAGFTLTYSVSNLPAWASFNTSTGALTGTPGTQDRRTFSNIQISVSDGFASASLPAFAIDVISSADSDGDTISDGQEGLDGTDPQDANDYLDLEPPELAAPADIILDATGLFTEVSLAQLLSLNDNASNDEINAALDQLVSDNVDGAGCCNPTSTAVADGMLLLQPGRTQITWQAEDLKENSSSVTQNVYVRPLVSVSKNAITTEGNTVSMSVLLNGRAPFYPFSVPYVIDASSTANSEDHSLINGSVTFNEGERSARVTIAITEDDLQEGSEQLVLRLDDRTTNAQDLQDGFDANAFDINAGVKTRYTLTIAETNLAPDVSLSLRQGDVRTILITPAGGNVTVNANATDPNAGDSLSFDWSRTDNSLSDIDGNASDATLTFNPAGLATGTYKLDVRVSDGQASDSAKLHFRVVGALPQLQASNDSDNDGVNDAEEGSGDSDDDGIPDYLDNIAETNVLPEVATQTNAFLMECDPGVLCRLGRFALEGNTGGARIDINNAGEIPGFVNDEDYSLNEVFDFEIKDIPESGQSVQVVIPQLAPIPENGEYRKLIDGRWQTFVEDANNALHSTAGELGFCPPPGDDSWMPGLTPGFACVQLTIQDGGPNDADGEANGSVEDPGGIGVRNITSVKTTGGGGSASLGLLLLAALVWVGRRARSVSVAMVMCVGLATLMQAPNVIAEETPRAFVELSMLSIKSDQSRSDFESDMAQAGVTASVTRYDVSQRAYHLIGGYAFHKNFSAHFGYADLGEVDVDFDSLAVSDEQLEAALDAAYPRTGSGFTFGGRGHYDVSDRMALGVDLGLFVWDGDLERVEGADVDLDVDGTDLWFGVFGNYAVSERVLLGLAWRSFALDGQGADGFGVSLKGRF